MKIEKIHVTVGGTLPIEGTFGNVKIDIGTTIAIDVSDRGQAARMIDEEYAILRAHYNKLKQEVQNGKPKPTLKGAQR